MVSNDVIDIFSISILNDERRTRRVRHETHDEHQKTTRIVEIKSDGFRVILPTQVAYNIIDPTNLGWSMEATLKIMRLRYSAEDIQKAMVIFIPVLYDRHWTIYALNRFHNQVDILDPLQYEREFDMRKYHNKFCTQLRSRLDAVLREFTNGQFPSILDWTFPFVDVPKMAPRHDCAFWCLLYLENYNPANRLMDQEINKEHSSQYRAQILHYLVWHDLNDAKRPFPEFLQQFYPFGA